MRTCFFDQHVKLGAKMVDFHGWDMPVQYDSILEEHKNVRSKVGIFDVSHMGRFIVEGKSITNSLQNMVTNDVERLQDNKALYSPMCFEDGGIIDDIIVLRINETKYMLVVNSSNIKKDYDWITKNLGDNKLKDITEDIAMVAVQGPYAASMMKKITDIDLDKMKPFDFASGNIFGTECTMSRTGYTGEDGFELFFDSSRNDIWDKLLENGKSFDIKPIGLGARDTLRLEAGLLLYGNDMDEKTTPLEVPLKWTVKFDKDFIGKKALENFDSKRKLVGFEITQGRRVARNGNEVLSNGTKVGTVTSGTFSPTLGKPIGFCFVSSDIEYGGTVQIKIGNRDYEAETRDIRFYKRK